MDSHLSLDEIRAALLRTQTTMLALLDGAQDWALHRRPTPDRWSLTENFAHVAEYRRFFAAETDRVRQQPGSAMGRTITDRARAQWIEAHARDDRAATRRGLEASFAVLMAVLERASEADLDLKGQHVHPKFGEQTLRDFVTHFLVEHDAKHVRQAQDILAQPAREPA